MLQQSVGLKYCMNDECKYFSHFDSPAKPSGGAKSQVVGFLAVFQ